MSTSTKAFSPYDSADYLVSAEDAAAYLEAALEQGGDDPAFVAQALGAIARSGNVSELLVTLFQRSLDRGTLPAFHAMNQALKARAEGDLKRVTDQAGP